MNSVSSHNFLVFFCVCSNLNHRFGSEFSRCRNGCKQSLAPKNQASKNPLVRSYLRVPQAAGQVKLWMISNVN